MEEKLENFWKGIEIAGLTPYKPRKSLNQTRKRSKSLPKMSARDSEVSGVDEEDISEATEHSKADSMYWVRTFLMMRGRGLEKDAVSRFFMRS